MSELPAPPTNLKVQRITAGWAIAEINQCLIMVWRDQPSAEPFKFRTDALRDITRRFPGKCAMVEVVEPSSKPPPDEQRPAAMAVFGELGTSLAAIAFLFEGGQLRATLNRAVITGMTFLVPQAQATKVFKAIGAMSVWVQERTSQTSPTFGAELEQAIAYLRAAMLSPGALSA